MLRRLLLIALTASLAAPLAAQAPEGWKVRVDRSERADDPDDTPDLKVVRMGNGFHVTGGPAGTFWNPANTASGNYTLKATFNLMKPSGHVNFYGLVFGGSNLEGAQQRYSYFLVAQNGQYTIRHRNGDQVDNIQGRTAHEAIRQPGENGQSANTLEVRVAGDTVSYVVNGTVVHTTPRAALSTDGIVGVRVNHLLDVHIQDFEVQRG
jgi:hypothetical protein